MYDFYNLIVRSLSETNIAHFYFYEYQKFGYGANSKVIFSEKLFYDKLINTIELCISDSHCNDDHLKEVYDMIEFEPDFEAYEKLLMKKIQDNYNENSINLKVKPIDWENCSNAGRLTEAFQQGLILKDPVKFITLNKDSTPDIFVIRKSKLEYLKSEVIRASKATTANDLDEIINLPNIENNPASEIRKKVEKAFHFTLKTVKNKKQILSNDDYLRLVEWVTFYFENKCELPYIDTPISDLPKGNRTYIRYAFKLLIDKIDSTYPKPDSFYILIELCFKDLEGDTKSKVQKTSKPFNWEKYTQ